MPQHTLVTVATAAAALALVIWLRRRLDYGFVCPWRLVGIALVGGAALGALTDYAAQLPQWLSGGGESPPWRALEPVALPALDQGLVLVMLLVFLRVGLLQRAAWLVVIGPAVAATLTIVQALLRAPFPDPPPFSESMLRALADLGAGAFSAGLWSYALGLVRYRGLRVTLAWLVAVAVGSIFDHLLWRSSAGVLIVVAPLFGFMVIAAASGFKELDRKHWQEATSRGHTLFAALPAPPSLSELRAAFRLHRSRLKLRWVVVGVLVYFGAALTLLAATVVGGQRLGVDFSRADEANLAANTPFLLLAAAVALAFLVAGWLIARASQSETLLESALAATIALLVATALLSATEPMALVFGLSVAPIAFSMACVGGWWASRKLRRTLDSIRPPSLDATG